MCVRRDDKLWPSLLDHPAGRLAGADIAHQRANFPQMRDPHWRGPLELSRVSDKDRVARAAQHRLCDLHLSIVLVEQGPVPVDCRRTEDCVIDAILLYEFDRRFPDDTGIGASHRAPGDYHL